MYHSWHFLQPECSVEGLATVVTADAVTAAVLLLLLLPA
jgi:hypothetical protein